MSPDEQKTPTESDALNPYEPPQNEIFAATPAENPFRRGDEMVVQYVRTLEDVVTLSLHIQGQRLRRAYGLLFGLLASLLFVLGLLMLVAGGWAWPFIAWVPSGVVAFAALPFMTNRRMRPAYRKILSKQTYLGLIGELELSISPAGVRELTEGGYLHTYWAAIDRVELNSEGVYLPIGNSRTFFVPVREFTSEQGMAEFVAEAERLLSSRRLPAQ